MYILGISAFYHDSAAAIIKDGLVIGAAQEERFTRKKHDMDFPSKAIGYCLKESNINLNEVDYVVFYDKPMIKFERILETYLAFAPKGFSSFLASMPVWLKDKLFLKSIIKKELKKISTDKSQKLPKLLFTSHHQSHAASAFYPSPYKDAAVLCLDGVGEWATTSAWEGVDNKLNLIWQINFPHSVGLLYSAFTYFCGFKVNSGEYKLMGLAPYGEPKYVDLILNNLIDLKDDGSFRLDMSYFNYAVGLTMTNKKFDKLFGIPARQKESKLNQMYMDVASSIQKVTEEIILRIAKNIRQETGKEYLCLAGGVALNCVANGHILRSNIFKDVWIQPASGDAGGALGAAYAVWYEYLGNQREVTEGLDKTEGSYLGPEFFDSDILNYLDSVSANYKKMDDETLYDNVSDQLESGKVVGWFNGRMEFGPRALCSRSIIGDARNTKMQTTMNLKIKHRESFRPFAPVVLSEDVSEFFEIDRQSPYMLLVAPVKKELCKEMDSEQKSLFGIEKLNIPRSTIPAVTHVDYSARVQTIHSETNPRFHKLLNKFKEKTGCSVLVNTSFNVRGEPIVCSPEDAYRCFMRTEMDYLVLNNYILSKVDQPAREGDDSWKDEFELD